MFEDQKIELLPARTTMKRGNGGIVNQSGNLAVAVAANVLNVNVGGNQLNAAAAAAAAGRNFG
jgi:methyl coenzyme M reductase subunit C